MRVWHGKLVLVLGFFGCTLMLTSWRVPPPDNSPLQLNLVYSRLMRAEQRGEALSHELLKVLNQLQNRSKALFNLTSSNSSGISSSPKSTDFLTLVYWHWRCRICCITSEKPNMHIQYISLSQATLPDCMGITTPLMLEDDNKSIMGKWIFLEGIADHHLFTYILKTLNSSWITFGPRSLANSVTLSQGNMLRGKCEFRAIEVTAQDSTFHISENDTITEGKFLPSCLDCLTMSFISQIKNITINSLYFFKRESNRTESDMDMYWKQAECLGFKREAQYSYDGVTELCHEAKDNSSNQKSNLDKSDQ